MISMHKVAAKAFGLSRTPISREERIQRAIEAIKADPVRVDEAIERGIDSKMINAQARFISLSMTTGRNSVQTVEAELDYFTLIEAAIAKMADEAVGKSDEYEAAA